MGKEDLITESMMNQRIEKLFSKSKLLCFGRYVLLAPQDAKLIFGSDFPTLPNKAKDIKQIMESRRAEILAKDKTSKINYFGPGPAPNVMWIRYYADEFSPKYGLESFDTYYIVGPHIFVGGGATSKSKNTTAETITARTIEVAQNLRPRAPDEVPAEPGLCHEFGFTRLAGDKGQVLSQVGLYLPELPDITFSVESNQNASTQGSNGHSLLKQINDRRTELGANYPKFTTLREGKRTLHGWAGEESLVRRADGTHDFEWKFIGETGNVAKPAMLDVTMYSKVKANRIGAASVASVDDEEALALWDKLLEGLKFRVAVPGAPSDAVALP